MLSEDSAQNQPALSGFDATLDAPKAKKRGRPKKAKEPVESAAVPTSTHLSEVSGSAEAPKRSSRLQRGRKRANDNSSITEEGNAQPESKERSSGVHFEYVTPPSSAEDWQPGAPKNSSPEPVYTGLPDAPPPAEVPVIVSVSSEGGQGKEGRPEHFRNKFDRHNQNRNHGRKDRAYGGDRRGGERPGWNGSANKGRGPQSGHGQKPGGHGGLQNVNKPTGFQQSALKKKQRPAHIGVLDAKEIVAEPQWGELPRVEALQSPASIAAYLTESLDFDQTPLNLSTLYVESLQAICDQLSQFGVACDKSMGRAALLKLGLESMVSQKRPIKVEGVLEVLEGGFGLLVYESDNYAQRPLSAFVPAALIKEHRLETGHLVSAWAMAPRQGDTTPVVLKIESLMSQSPENWVPPVPFNEQVPYYPLERILLEHEGAAWDNVSMRVVDLLSPIGLGQRGLIVAPPRTGKTILLQNIAHAIAVNKPDAHLIVLLIDERPEEVTDFRRHVKGEVIASTFDQSPETHVHAAEMVIAKARRMAEEGKHVIILLDSITRLARAYNALMPSSGKILSGGVEANALERPKRFFGSARNIEGGGSLTILGTALIETGSKMDEVIFEEFKGTGNMELHLDRSLAEKRVFPALNFEKSGTRKEELLYHKDELSKIYALRRAMKGVPAMDAMEMLIQRVKKTKSNPEFLISMAK